LLNTPAPTLEQNSVRMGFLGANEEELHPMIEQYRVAGVSYADAERKESMYDSLVGEIFLMLFAWLGV
jgi:hypothetical protein